MKALSIIFISIAIATAFFAGGLYNQPALAAEEVQDQETPKLAIVWTSGDRDVALKMVFMYALNAKRRGWASEVEMIVWGPSSKLLSNDLELQAEVVAMQEVGVVFKACKACADSYGISDKLQELGIEVKYMGVDLTEFIVADDWEVITF
jgi:hypothetical protein